MIHSQGSVDHVEYSNLGTFLDCSVPPSLHSRLQSYVVKKKKPSTSSQ